MKLGFNGATTMTSDLATDIRVAGAAGFDVLEITATKLDRSLEMQPITQVRKQMDAAQLKAHAINSIEKINFRDASGRADVLARTRQLAQSAQSLDCPWIVSVPGPAPEGTSWAETCDETVASLRAMARIAAMYNANLAFEFLGFAWCSVRTAAQAWEIVRKTDRANVGMVIDTCHFYAGDSTLESIRDIDAGRLAIFHINDVEPISKDKITDAHRLFPGDGVIPLKPIVDGIRAIGFEGVASVEIFRPEYWQRDPLSVAKEAKEKTEKQLSG